MMRKCLVVIFVTLTSFTVTLACNGYKFTFGGVENCHPDNNLYVHEGFSVTMNDNCEITPVGCVEIHHPFSTSVGNFLISKPPLPPIQGKADFCEAMEKYSEYLDVIMEMFGVPKRCPYEAAKFCMDGTKSVDMGAMKSKLGMAVGNVELFMNTTMDGTMITCIKTKFKLEKPKKPKSG